MREAAPNFLRLNSLSFITKTMRESVRIQSDSGPHSPTSGLNTERYSVNLHNQSECFSTYWSIIFSKF